MLNIIFLRVFQSMNTKVIQCITEKTKIALTHKAIGKKDKQKLQHSLEVHLIKD